MTGPSERAGSRLRAVLRAFNEGERALGESIGEEQAREMYAQQREVASKAHREPPESIRHMRFR